MEEPKDTSQQAREMALFCQERIQNKNQGPRWKRSPIVRAVYRLVVISLTLAYSLPCPPARVNSWWKDGVLPK